jgi:hypothetical protein
MVHMMVNLPIDISENGFIITLVALLWCPVVKHEQMHLPNIPNPSPTPYCKGEKVS